MKLHLIIFLLLLSGIAVNGQPADNKPSQKKTVKTFCNPMNISYRFCLDEPSRREAADPVIVLFRDKYYLFASKSGGYWYSDDLLKWTFVPTKELPIENYAPAAVVIGDWLYFMASTSPLPKTLIYRSSDPVSGKWELVNDSFPIQMTDPDLFADSDGRVYFYYGCSNSNPIMAVELDKDNKLNPIGTPVVCFGGNPADHGWEQTGDYNNSSDSPWIEGAWINKFNGKYYLQYAAPGTQYKSYADGVYVSEKPLGPFTYQANNPFSSRPEGFVAGAGHGASFTDKYGNWWHIATMTISVKHMFERRLGLFPSGFDKDGNLLTYTGFGDYPLILPEYKFKTPDELFKGWMLLSYKKDAAASTQYSACPPILAFDEDIRTYWSAATGNKGEWLSVDLGNVCTINAIQVNFAENNTSLHGREKILCHQYIVEYSSDNKNWKMLLDKSKADEDLTHQYEVIEKPVNARYLRITNYRVPDGTFAISDFRIFGKGSGSFPAVISSFQAERDPADPRVIKISWEKQKDAIGYNIRYGNQNDQLYHNYQVYNETSLTIRSLDKGVSYWFVIDSFGENGVSTGSNPKKVQ
jgi:xylan 1,4-beta-xylosidase